MHPVLGTMMPEICEAPHLSDFPLYSSLCSGFNVGDALISFSFFCIMEIIFIFISGYCNSCRTAPMSTS